jgi:hypothetical protein
MTTPGESFAPTGDPAVDRVLENPALHAARFEKLSRQVSSRLGPSARILLEAPP